MTQLITNLAAMMLIDDGKLALDDPVSKYIPAFAAVKVGVESETKEGQPVLSLVPTDRSVSIEDLMRHASVPAITHRSPPSPLPALTVSQVSPDSPRVASALLL